MANESDFPTNSNEPYASGYPGEDTEYNKMKIRYGEFYIGRFEAGVNSTTLRTGNVSTDVSKNICHLAGNCREWTMEVDSISGLHVEHGGFYYYATPVSLRSSYVPSNAYDYSAFCREIYVK